MVRLKDDLIAANATIQSRFNSEMVRLKVSGPETNKTITFSFQFRNGSIKRDPIPFDTEDFDKFQFRNGSIKSAGA